MVLKLLTEMLWLKNIYILYRERERERKREKVKGNSTLDNL